MIDPRFRSKADSVENAFVKKVINTFYRLDKNGKLQPAVCVQDLPTLSEQERILAISAAHTHYQNEPLGQDGRTFAQVEASTLMSRRLERFCELSGFDYNYDQHNNAANGHDVRFIDIRGELKLISRRFELPIYIHSTISRLEGQCFNEGLGGSDFWIVVRIIENVFWLDAIISKEFLIRHFGLDPESSLKRYYLADDIKSYLLYQAPDCLVLNKDYPTMSDERFLKRALQQNTQQLIVF